MKEEDAIVVLRVFYNLQQAQLAESKLLASGIPCYLTDTHMSALYASWGQPFGGIRLMVFQRDKETAIALIDSEVNPIQPNEI
jgi:hypothetical protein